MDKQILNLLIFIIFCFVVYVFFKHSTIEGMTTDTDASSNTITTSSLGVAGNAQTYAANIKTAFIKNQDVLLISKYRTDYENAVLNLDDFINSNMLLTALNIDLTNPNSGLQTLARLNETKSALNNVMKYIDSNH
jgi:preprotein translocase subunit SecG